MLKVEAVGYSSLSDEQKNSVSDNGSGKEWANYLKVTHNDEIVALKSDAMEPEDASFSRDLNWIYGLLRKCYELGQIDGK